jgi:hypothetical protein
MSVRSIPRIKKVDSQDRKAFVLRVASVRLYPGAVAAMSPFAVLIRYLAEIRSRDTERALALPLRRANFVRLREDFNA